MFSSNVRLTSPNSQMCSLGTGNTHTSRGVVNKQEEITFITAANKKPINEVLNIGVLKAQSAIKHSDGKES